MQLAEHQVGPKQVDSMREDCSDFLPLVELHRQQLTLPRQAELHTPHRLQHCQTDNWQPAAHSFHKQRKLQLLCV